MCREIGVVSQLIVLLTILHVTVFYRIAESGQGLSGNNTEDVTTCTISKKYNIIKYLYYSAAYRQISALLRHETHDSAQPVSHVYVLTARYDGQIKRLRLGMGYVNDA